MGIDQRVEYFGSLKFIRRRNTGESAALNRRPFKNCIPDICPRSAKETKHYAWRKQCNIEEYMEYVKLNSHTTRTLSR